MRSCTSTSAMPSTLRNPGAHDLLRDFRRDLQAGGERLGGLGHLLLEGLRRNFLFLLHVDVPAGELLRQARVLAAATDGEREVLLIDQHGDLVPGLVDLDGLELRGLERLDGRAP